MGLFGSIFGRAKAVTLDASSGALRRNALAEAVDNARQAPKRAAAHRLAAANATAARMMFQSADVGRLTGDWPTQPVPADWIIARFQRTLVARSREQAANNDYMKAFLRLKRLNIVGPKGIQFHSRAMRNGAPDMEARAAVENWLDEWGKAENCDIAGKLSWRAMQQACVDSAARDGEFFVRMIYGSDAPMGFALQLVDAQRCPVDLDRTDLPGGGFIRQGIEFNRYGRPTFYYFADDSAQRGTMAYSYGGREFVRVPAADVIHGFRTEMPGQKRGLPWAATGLFRAKQVQAGEDAAVVNMRMGAAKMGFIEFADGHGPDHDFDEDDLTIDAEPGAFPVLPEGAKLNTFDPLYPSGELVPFVKLMHRGFAAGSGVAYHSISQDLTDVNFSSIRHGTLDERETYKDEQEWLRETLCERVLSVALPRALLARQVVTEDGTPLAATKVKAYMAGVWQPRRWSWIDPRADVEAAEKWKNNLLASPSAQIREQGNDPDDVWKETAEDIAAMKAAGIPMEVIVASFGQKPTPPAGEVKGTKQE